MAAGARDLRGSVFSPTESRCPKSLTNFALRFVELRPNSIGGDSYNRLSVVQPANHPIIPFVSLPIFVMSIGLWYNVLNQFMIQRVLGAKPTSRPERPGRRQRIETS